VSDAGIKKMKEDTFYDVYNRTFAYYFTTMPVVILTRDKWVPLSRLAPNLELTKGRTNSSIRAVLQRSILRLSQADAELLTQTMECVGGQEDHASCP
jgi:hypothetical protein